MKTAKEKIAYPDFRSGWIYARHPKSLPPGALSDGENVWIELDELKSRPPVERAYTQTLSATCSNLFSFYLTTGDYIVLFIRSTGGVRFWNTVDESASAIVLTLANGFAPHGEARAYKDVIYVAPGYSRPMRLVPWWPGGGGSPDTRLQPGGCFAPLLDPADQAIGLAVHAGPFPGLGQGHYWYAESITFGPQGAWGESGLGAVGQASVPSSLDGIGRVVNSGTGLPAAASTYITSSPNYYGAWARRLWRTEADGDRNGPYYPILEVGDMTTTSFEDRINDLALDRSLAKYVDDDPMLPPIAEFCELHQNRMIYGDERHIWWSEVGLSGEALPDMVHSSRNIANLPIGSEDWMTGMASVMGTLVVATKKAVLMIDPGPSGGIRNQISGVGNIAKKAFQRGPSDAIFMLDLEGPMVYSGGQVIPLGGTESSKRIRDYLRDFCNDWEVCCGKYHEGKYYLSYPDRRDSPPPGNPCTRTMVWDSATGVWSPPMTGVSMNCLASDEKRLLWVDNTWASGITVMQFNPSRLDDWRPASQAYAAPTVRARFGGYSKADQGSLAVPTQVLFRWKCGTTGSGFPVVTAYYDGTAGTSKTLSASNPDYPSLGVYPMARQMAKDIQVEFKSTVTCGPWALCDMTQELGDDE